MTGECPYKKSITSGWHDMCLICLGNIQRLASLNLNLFRVFVTRERRRAFLMCPAAGLPPRFVCHFVRPHKNATRSCVDEEGDGIGCLMDIPEAIILASWWFFLYIQCKAAVLQTPVINTLVQLFRQNSWPLQRRLTTQCNIYQGEFQHVK